MVTTVLVDSDLMRVEIWTDPVGFTAESIAGRRQRAEGANNVLETKEDGLGEVGEELIRRLRCQ